MSKKIIVNKEINYNRNAILYIENNKIFFDTADNEYGKGVITLEEIEKAITKYKKLNE